MHSLAHAHAIPISVSKAPTRRIAERWQASRRFEHRRLGEARQGPRTGLVRAGQEHRLQRAITRAPRVLQELLEFDSLIVAMESLRIPPNLYILTSLTRIHRPFTLLPCPLLLSGNHCAPPLGGQGTPCWKGKVRKGRVGEQETKKRKTGELAKKVGCNKRTSQKVTHPSTTLAQTC